MLDDIFWNLNIRKIKIKKQKLKNLTLNIKE